MNRKRLVIVLLLALVSGGVAGYSALEYLRQRPTPLLPEPTRRTTDIVVAARDLPIGYEVASEDVLVLDWPSEAVPAGYLTSPDQVVGRGLLTPMRMFEPFLDAKLGEPGIGGGLPIIIPEGMRAVTVRVDEVIGVAGFVQPQTRVDVLLTVTPPGESQPITRTILQNVLALSAGQQYQTIENGEPVVVGTQTLLLSPTDAEKIVHAAGQGRIQLALRNKLDMDTVTTSGARVSTLLQGAPAPRSAARSGGGGAAPQAVQPTQTAPRRSEVEVLRGANRALIQYNNP